METRGVTHFFGASCGRHKKSMGGCSSLPKLARPNLPGTACACSAIVRIDSYYSRGFADHRSRTYPQSSVEIHTSTDQVLDVEILFCGRNPQLF